MLSIAFATLVTAPTLTRVGMITGRISPKSIVHSGSGVFFAQNMMYAHDVTVYDRTFTQTGRISDKVALGALCGGSYKGSYQGSPVECAFTSDGREAWVSNYQMYGPGFRHPGNDKADGRTRYDSSFLYRIDVPSQKVVAAVKVGSVPKFVAVTPDGQKVLASNWASYDLSIVSAKTNLEERRIRLGRFPRGIAVDGQSRHAYVAVMGSTSVADLDLATDKVTWIRNVGTSPRHLCLDAEGRYLYATLNGEGRVAKIDLAKRKRIAASRTGSQPRSMVLRPDGKFLYVVNYDANSFSQVRTADMKVTRTVKVNRHPIGITYDGQAHRVWVACYSGSILVYQEG